MGRIGEDNMHARTAGAHRCFSLIEIQRVVGLASGEDEGSAAPGGEAGEGTAVYCRVSSHEQKAKGDLDRQVQVAVDHCTSAGLGTPAVYTDVGRGLNARRGGLKRMCRVIERGQVRWVFITYKDRLTRFGFEYLQRYFSSHGASIGVICQMAARTMDEELVADLIAIITSFSVRVHGRRGHRNHGKSKAVMIDGIIAGVVGREIRKAVDAVARRVARA